MSEFDTAKMAIAELLQKNGTLDSLKAQLRSSVFLALQTTPHAQKNRTEKSAQDTELAFLVKEFLQTLGLSNTAAVFEAEWGQVIEGTEATRAISKTESTLIGSFFKVYKSGSNTNSPVRQIDTLAPKALSPLAKDVLKKIPPPPTTMPPTSTSKTADLVVPADGIVKSKSGGSEEIQLKDDISSRPPSSPLPLEPSSSILSPSTSLPSPSPKTTNMLAIEIDADKIQTTKKTHVDTPLVSKATADQWESRDKAPRQRYRSNNQPTEDFYQAPPTQQPKSDKEEEESAGSEQHSSDRSASKAPESSVDYFEPIIKDL